MDRAYRGFAAGLVAAIIKNVVNLVLYQLKLVEVRFLDWGGVLMLGYPPQTKAEIIYGLIIHLLWTGTLGLIFSFLIGLNTSRGILLKGGIYSFVVTFIFRVIANFMEIPLCSSSMAQTNMINTGLAFGWGLLMAELLTRYNQSE